MPYTRSPFKIQGNKFALLHHVNTVASKFILPEYKYDVWVEAFMGSGTVGFNLANGPAAFFDINPHLIGFFDAIKTKQITAKDIREALRREQIAFKQTGAEHFYLLREKFNKDPDPMTFFLLNRTSYNGLIRFNKSGGYNTPYCRNDAKITNSLIEFLCETVEELSKKIEKWDWTFAVADFNAAIEYAQQASNPLLFLDPPYIERNPTYFTSWSENDEERLFQAIRECQLPFILTTWVKNRQGTHTNKFFETLWAKHFDFLENDHTYIINGTKKEIDSVKIKEAIVYKSNKGAL